MLTPPNADLLVISGPTGVGKSELAIALARELRGEIVNYDSIQVYRGFDLGSAKPSAAIRSAVPHHLFDIVDPGQLFNAADYAGLAEKVIEEIRARGGTPILVGGTGFYLRALLAGLPPMPESQPRLRDRIRRIMSKPGGGRRLHGLLKRVDPVSVARISQSDRHRLERALEVYLLTGQPISSWSPPSGSSPSRFRACKLALHLPRPMLVQRLDRRVEHMYEQGLIEETQDLARKYPPDSRPFGSIGYKEALSFLGGHISKSDAIEQTQKRTRSYAKRQLTWLRAERDTHWIDASDGPDTMLNHALAIWRSHC